MKKYYFYDYGEDMYDNEEYDFDEISYYKLLDACFLYGDYFSLDFQHWETSFYQSLCEYEVYPTITNDLLKLWTHTYRITYYIEDQNKKMVEPDAAHLAGQGLNRRFFSCCDETKKELSELKSVFAYMWKQKELPENMIFYRTDGSVIISVCTHEGELTLFPRNNESWDEILNMKKEHWCVEDN